MEPRNLALKILLSPCSSPGQLGKNFEQAMESYPGISERDKSFIAHIIYGVTRWRHRIDYILSLVMSRSLASLDIRLLVLLRMAVYQILYLDRVPDFAVVNEAVKMTKFLNIKYSSGLVNGVLRTICRKKFLLGDIEDQNTITKTFSIKYSYPEWLIEKWVQEMGGAETEKLLSAANRYPGIALRTNTCLINRQELKDMLEAEGIMAEPSKYAPEGLIIQKLTQSVASLLPYRKGFFTVQGEASQIASSLLPVSEGDLVADICSGLGGKSLAIADKVGQNGSILSIDCSSHKRKLFEQNIDRLGIKNITLITADATLDMNYLFVRKSADAVLLDAPCSGLGNIGRYPDAKWNRTPEDINRLASMQKKILNRASEILRPGGYLLYLTCTISKDENDNVIEDFLKIKTNFEQIHLRGTVPENQTELIDKHGFLRILPHLHNIEGFFGALMLKTF